MVATTESSLGRRFTREARARNRMSASSSIAARRAMLLAVVACRRGSYGQATNGSSSALPAGVEDLGPTLEPIRAAHNGPALGAAVWRDDAIVAIGAAGVRAAGHDARVTIEDKWHLGSDTKAMTAVLIGIYVDRGVL